MPIVGFGKSHCPNDNNSSLRSSRQWAGIALTSYRLASRVHRSTFKRECPGSSVDPMASSARWTMSWSSAETSPSMMPDSRPFGISSAPEHFQKRMSRILSGPDGILCQMDDVLVFGRDQSEHDARLTAVLQRIESAGATLNPDKCEFGKSTLKFLGHLIDEKGI